LLRRTFEASTDFSGKKSGKMFALTLMASSSIFLRKTIEPIPNKLLARARLAGLLG
jgi:hypothetical protein